MKKTLLFFIFLFVSSLIYSQERKLEKKVMPLVVESKYDEAFKELYELKDKYNSKAFFQFWRGYIFQEKLYDLKKNFTNDKNATALNYIDSCILYFSASKGLLMPEDIKVKENDFSILFPSITFTQSSDLFNKAIDEKLSKLEDLKFNFQLDNLGNLIRKRSYDDPYVNNILSKAKSKIGTANTDPFDKHIANDFYQSILNTAIDLKVKEIWGWNKKTDKISIINYLRTINHVGAEQIKIEIGKKFIAEANETFNTDLKAACNGLESINTFIENCKSLQSDCNNNPDKILKILFLTEFYSSSFMADLKNSLIELQGKAEAIKKEIEKKLAEETMKIELAKIKENINGSNSNFNSDLYNKLKEFTKKWKQYKNIPTFTEANDIYKKESRKIKNDLKKDELLGDVKQMTEIEYKIVDNGGEQKKVKVFPVIITVYNENGNALEYSEINESGKVGTLKYCYNKFGKKYPLLGNIGGAKWKPTFDNDNNCIKESVMSDKDVVDFIYGKNKVNINSKESDFNKNEFGYRYSYDNAGNRIESVLYGPEAGMAKAKITKTVYVYDEKGNLTETKDYKNNDVVSSEINKYDEAGNKIETKKQTGNNVTITKYDENDLIIEESENGSITSTKYKFDKLGNYVEYSDFDSKGAMISQRTFTYKYDNQDNWIEKNTFKDNKLIKVVERKIVYFGDNKPMQNQQNQEKEGRDIYEDVKE